MEIEKTGNPNQDNCNHEFELLRSNEKSLDGFYKNKDDYEPGELYNTYICQKCSKIITIDYTKDNISPVIEFENENKIVKAKRR